MPVLLCLRHLKYPLGVGRVAEVVTGSRSQAVLERGLDRNPAFGQVRRGQAEVKEVIEELILAGYLDRNRYAEYPVLTLSPMGKKAAVGLSAASAPAAQTRLVKRKPAGRSSPGEMDVAILQCVREMPFRVGADKIAEAVAGSRAEWIGHAGIDGYEFYGAVNATQAAVKKRITSLLGRELLTRSSDHQFPVIELTEAGLAELG